MKKLKYGSEDENLEPLIAIFFKNYSDLCIE